MKFFATLTIFVICAVLNAKGLSLEEKKKMMMPAIEKCKSSTGATDDHVAKVMTHVMPSTREEKCFLSCMMEGCGVVTYY
jgi:hypothetical protein